MVSSRRKKTVGKRTTTASSPLGDRKVKIRKRGATHPGFIDGASRRQRSRGQIANSRPEPKSIYPGTAGAVPKTSNLSNSMRARLGPQEPRRPRPPIATTWGAHLDPRV
ncbi:hypothetical protein CK203_075954 [Vitis vinifera]|uniref:Uncharacterized protein n=1 Tax=Vitis vinifera TaxID=29760 RepID=A0A438C2Q4_VITVI|nr:hypothetical protein CK203_075954 [Vitis vinifera]